MSRTRRTYTPEFKTEAVKLVPDQGYSVAEAARSLDLPEVTKRNNGRASVAGSMARCRPWTTRGYYRACSRSDTLQGFRDVVLEAFLRK